MKQKTDYKKLKQALTRIMSDGLTHQKSQLIQELGHMTPRKDKERVIRKTVELINQDDEHYPDVLIIGTSDRSGYRLGTNIDDIEHFKNERKKRAERVALPILKAERLIRSME